MLLLLLLLLLLLELILFKQEAVCVYERSMVAFQSLKFVT